ncbi:MAG: hypothetical protein AAB372_01700 [Patescibacteria group bacterium]
MSRRTQIILGIIAIILIIALGVWLFLRNRTGSTAGGGLPFFGGGNLPSTGGNGGSLGGGSTPGGELENIPTGGTVPVTEEEKKRLVQLTHEPTIGATVSPAENRVMYFKLGLGHLFDTAFDGEGGEVNLSTITTKNIIDVDWSTKKTYAFVTGLINDSVENHWFHITSTSTVEHGTFREPIVSADFSPSAEKLVTIVRAGKTSTVRTSNPDGSNMKQLIAQQIPDLDVEWIRQDLVFLKTKTSAFAETLLETVSIPSGISTFVPFNQKGVDVLWHPDGDQYLASVSDDNGAFSSITLRSRTSPNYKPFLYRTVPEKCYFSKKDSKVLYCAIPKNFTVDSMPDIWWQGSIQFSDELWKINIESGETTILLDGGGFDITNLFTSPNENFIFFINKNDLTLWSYRLL